MISQIPRKMKRAHENGKSHEIHFSTSRKCDLRPRFTRSHPDPGGPGGATWRKKVRFHVRHRKKLLNIIKMS